MDKIVLIRQEIERLKKLLEESTYYLDNSQQALGYSFALDDFNEFLDTLSEEPDKSLEEEIKDYFQGYWPGTDTAEQCNTDLHFTPPAIMRLARHFAKWQKEQMIEEAVEGEVVKDINNKLAVTAKNVNLDRFNFGDKVNIIILPKED